MAPAFKSSSSSESPNASSASSRSLRSASAAGYLFSSETESPHDGRDTFVIVASKKPLDLDDLTQNSSHWPGSPFASLETNSQGKLIARGQMNEVLANAHGMVLTDDFAPVDNLLSTVFDAK